MPLGISPAPDLATAQCLREELAQGSIFEAILASRGLTIDLSALIPYARWQPGSAERPLIRRWFDARLYVARAPRASRSCEIVVDPSEISGFRWATAPRILRCCEEGAAYALFPTRRILERIAAKHGFADVVNSIPGDPFRAVIPRTEMLSGEMHLCIPDDLGYLVTRELWSRVRCELVSGGPR